MGLFRNDAEFSGYFQAFFRFIFRHKLLIFRQSGHFFRFMREKYPLGVSYTFEHQHPRSYAACTPFVSGRTPVVHYRILCVHFGNSVRPRACEYRALFPRKNLLCDGVGVRARLTRSGILGTRERHWLKPELRTSDYLCASAILSFWLAAGGWEAVRSFDSEARRFSVRDHPPVDGGRSVIAAYDDRLPSAAG